MLFNPNQLKKHAILAPMAGVTDSPFRRIARKMGAGILYSELVSAEGLIRNSKKTEQLLFFDESERPFGIQLFCGKPDSLAEAVKITESFKPDFIDLNFGCPVKKVVKNNAGSAVLKDLGLMQKLVSAAVKNTGLPVTAKIRTGWDQDSIVAVEAARIIEEEGAQAIAVHARTRAMGYTGRADWVQIRHVKAAVSVPVLGNGDIWSAADAGRMFKETGCAGVMIGRAAMGNPWIFNQVNAYLSKGKIVDPPSPGEKIDCCISHLEEMITFYGYPKGLLNMRKHMGWYLKGLPGSSAVRQTLFRLEDVEAVKEVLRGYGERLVA